MVTVSPAPVVGVVTRTSLDDADALPAASRALTVYEYVVPAVAVVSVNDVDVGLAITLVFRITW